MYIFSGILRKLYKYYYKLVLAVSPDLIIGTSWYRTVDFGNTVSFLAPNKALVAHTFCNTSHITDLILIRVTSFFAIRTTLIEMLISRAFLIKLVKIVFGIKFDGIISNFFANFPLILQVLRGLQLPSVSRTKPSSHTHCGIQISAHGSWTHLINRYRRKSPKVNASIFDSALSYTRLWTSFESSPVSVKIIQINTKIVFIHIIYFS